ncbi:GTPase Era [Candidatus Providencia siddallii]|uniref:GTPase Era n=1 Tax=Candidatus Providencia siddallii TaxID=1715285 RepID=A0A0M6W761_9GAMM|nr:GTPase Era [Candidatus Providencia siddallii]
MNKTKQYCGFVAIIGRPNVGKSTLLNKLLKKKISITSKKPQTTRQNITGIYTSNKYQIIYTDTPGICFNRKKNIDCLIEYSYIEQVNYVELIIFIVDGIKFTENDSKIISKLIILNRPVILVINKIDNITNKNKILPYIDLIRKKMNFLSIIPISAKKEIGINSLLITIKKHIPESIFFFPKNYITDKSDAFMASEIVREKLIRFLGDELPYSVNVKIEDFNINKNNILYINGSILIKHINQKKIIIGKNGNKIKKIGIESRIAMEKIFKHKIQLKLWVKSLS